MAVLLFNLRNVPDDEADEVRALLTENNFDFYETSAGKWGISVAAIWLKDDARLPQARELLVNYQMQRSQEMRAEHQRLKDEGKLETFADRVRLEPLKVFIYLVIILVILYFSIAPWLKIA